MFQFLLTTLTDWCAVLSARVRRVRLKHLLFDLPVLVVCLYLALWLRVDPESYFAHAVELSRFLPIFIFTRVAIFIAMGVYDILWRYLSIGDISLILKAVFVSSVANNVLRQFIPLQGIPHGVFLINAILIAVSLTAIRLFRRYLHEYPSQNHLKKNGRPTLIYGAGRNGLSVAHRLLNDEVFAHQPVGFIDDDPEKTGRVIAGLPVLGTFHRLSEVIEEHNVAELIIAVSKPSGEVLSSVLMACLPRGIRPRLIKVADGVSTPGSPIDVLREIQLDDLLARESRQIDLSELRESLRARCVLVTGAGGSIGSELARQIFRLNPGRLLVLDHSEFNLYEVDRDLRSGAGDGRVVPLLVDIKNRSQLETVFRKYQPEIVFHAAAYKHVHLVEANPLPAILNNIQGTKNLVDLSLETGVESFILISTDKAVNPGGIMGATKRVCELLISAAGARTGRRFASVRFGNVLGSSGSLVPLLKEQVSQGKPVTITHPNMKRYFMLIPEAVSLVLRASTLALAGDIMVLKMGKAVRIVDLAKSLILLLGKTEKEVPIVFTGMRPGEKLEEELYLTGAEARTDDPDVMVVPKGDMLVEGEHNSYFFVDRAVRAIIHQAETGNNDAVSSLWKLIKHGPTFQLDSWEDEVSLAPKLVGWSGDPLETSPTLPIAN